MSFAALIATVCTTACKIAAAVIKISVNIDILRVIGKILGAIGEALGIIPPGKEMEEVGDKALQAEEAGITPDKFRNYEDYRKAVEGYETDPEKSKQYTAEQKIQKAIEYEVAALLCTYPKLPVSDIVMTVAQNHKYFTEARVAQLGALAKDHVELLGDIAHFMQGKEKDLGKIDSTVDLLTRIEKKLDPGLSDADAQKIVMGSRIETL